VVGQLKFIKEMLERLGGDGVTVETTKAILKGLRGVEGANPWLQTRCRRQNRKVVVILGGRCRR